MGLQPPGCSFKCLHHLKEQWNCHWNLTVALLVALDPSLLAGVPKGGGEKALAHELVHDWLCTAPTSTLFLAIRVPGLRCVYVRYYTGTTCNTHSNACRDTRNDARRDTCSTRVEGLGHLLGTFARSRLTLWELLARREGSKLPREQQVALPHTRWPHLGDKVLDWPLLHLGSECVPLP